MPQAITSHPKRRTLIRGGWSITEDEQLGELRADILISGDRIAAIAPSIDATVDEVIDAADFIVMPGFVDTHRHTWQSSMRLIGPGWNFDEYLYKFLLPYGARFSAEDVYAGTLLGALSAIDAGITTLRDESNIQNSPQHADAAIQALRDSGMRAIFDHGYPMTEPAAWLRESQRTHPDDIRRIRRDVLTSDDALVTLNMMLRGPEMTTLDVTRSDLQLMRELGLRGCLHIGCGKVSVPHRAVGQLHSHNLLGPDLTFIHCCMCSDDELLAIKSTGGSVSVPANVDATMPGLGMPITMRAQKLGLRPALSVDVETSAAPDMFTVMRAANMAQQIEITRDYEALKEQPTFTSRDLLAFATIDGARACGIDASVGSLAVGKKADLILIGANDINLALISDAAAAVVTSAHSGNVDSVMVDGRFLKRNRKLVRIDEQRTLELARGSRERLIQAVASPRRLA
jgi:5-methylthioadenosine/S-adenosylhomocysteine deaminase